MTITEVSKKINLLQDTLRYYERLNYKIESYEQTVVTIENNLKRMNN